MELATAPMSYTSGWRRLCLRHRRGGLPRQPDKDIVGKQWVSLRLTEEVAHRGGFEPPTP